MSVSCSPGRQHWKIGLVVCLLASGCCGLPGCPCLKVHISNSLAAHTVCVKIDNSECEYVFSQSSRNAYFEIANATNIDLQIHLLEGDNLVLLASVENLAVNLETQQIDVSVYMDPIDGLTVKWAINPLSNNRETAIDSVNDFLERVRECPTCQ